VVDDVVLVVDVLVEDELDDVLLELLVEVVLEDDVDVEVLLVVVDVVVVVADPAGMLTERTATYDREAPGAIVTEAHW
jgi:hypothetical protein